MAYLIGPSEASRLVFTIVATNGSTKGLFKSKAGRPATYYVDPDPTAEPTASMLTTLADVRRLDGTPYEDGTVTIDAFSMLPTMRFPDGTPAPDSLLVTCDGGPPVRVYAREDDRLDSLATSVTVEASARAAADTAVSAAAAADATTKANAAQSAAISAAATDATTKANAAQAAAVQRGNHTGTQDADTLTDGVSNKVFTAALRDKLAGIAAGATANSTDAQLRDRSLHTGFQPVSTVTGLQDALNGKADLVDGVLSAEQVPDLANAWALFFNVKNTAYAGGAKGDNATDDTAAIQATINAAWAAKASTVYFPAGTYLAADLVLPTGIHLRGDGAAGDIYSNTEPVNAPFRGTTLKLKDGGNADLISTIFFSALTGLPGASPSTSPSRFGIHDMVLDGNRANNTTGWPLRIHGRTYTIENVHIQNGKSGGAYSEWGTGGYEMEAHWRGVHIFDNSGIGLDWHGPHDSSFVDVFVARNDGHVGINLGGGSPVGAVGGEMFTNVHVWGAHTYQWVISTFNGMFVNCVADGPGGVQVLTGGHQWIGGNIYGSNQPGQVAITVGDGTARIITGNRFITRLHGYAKGSAALRFWPDDAGHKLNEWRLSANMGGNTRYAVTGKSTLTGSVTFPVTTIAVADASSFPTGGGTLYIGDGTTVMTASLAYTGVSGNTLTGVTGGTGGVTFAAGAAIFSLSVSLAQDTIEIFDPDNPSTPGFATTAQAGPQQQFLSSTTFNVGDATFRANTSATAFRLMHNNSGRLDVLYDNTGTGRLTSYAPFSLGGTSGNGYLQFDVEQSADPAAPAANQARLFTRDNGSGKTQLCVRFNTGAVQVLATEP